MTNYYDSDVENLSVQTDAERLQMIRVREKNASEGPWDFAPHFVRARWEGQKIAEQVESADDSWFIAGARGDVPWLLGLVDRTSAERDALRQMLVAVKDALGYLSGDSQTRLQREIEALITSTSDPL